MRRSHNIFARRSGGLGPSEAGNTEYGGPFRLRTANPEPAGWRPGSRLNQYLNNLSSTACLIIQKIPECRHDTLSPYNQYKSSIQRPLFRFRDSQVVFLSAGRHCVVCTCFTQQQQHDWKQDGFSSARWFDQTFCKYAASASKRGYEL
jgi:hypothetical protein